MRKKSWYSFFAFALLLNLPFSNSKVADTNESNATPPDACHIENVAFEAGEEIIYKVYYNWNFVWLTAGEVRFRVEDAGNQYHLSATGRSYKSYEWLYRVRDRYDTYVSKKTLLPSVSSKTLEEGNYRLYDKTLLNQSNYSATTWRGKTKDKTKQFEFELGECMHDMISMMYYSRNLDFEGYQAGTTFPVKIFMDKTVYPLDVKYFGKKQKKIKGVGKFNTILFSPEVVEGTVFKEGNQMKVWVSDDKNKIPVLIESPLSVGSAKIILQEYKGLKYDFEAAIEQ
ncbi:MAG: DUF3108 domain-containing protein [Bacteroidota bacterium]